MAEDQTTGPANERRKRCFTVGRGEESVCTAGIGLPSLPKQAVLATMLRVSGVSLDATIKNSPRPENFMSGHWDAAGFRRPVGH